MSKYYINIIFLFISLCACSEKYISVEDEIAKGAIVFTTQVCDISKSGDTNIQTIKGDGGILVSSYYSDTNPQENFFEKLNFLYDSKNNLWTSDPVVFWSASEKLDFYGYYPTDLDINTSDPGLLNYTVNSNAEDQQDIVMAYVSNQTEEPSVKMTFQHALSKLTFKVITKANSGLNLNISGITIKNIPMTADIRLVTTATQVPDYFTTSNYSSFGDATETIPEGEGSLTAGTADVSIGTFNPFYIIPHIVDVWVYNTSMSAAELSSKTYINISGVMSGPTDYQTQIIVPFPSEVEDAVTGQLVPLEWKPGYEYEYNITFGDYNGQSGGGGYTPDETQGGKPLPIIMPIKITVNVKEWNKESIGIDLGA